MLQMNELVDEYLDDQKIYRFEGTSGVHDLNRLASAMGYREQYFKYGSPLELFLGDNPGACEALVNWIRDQEQDEWKEELESCLPEEEEEEEEEEDEDEDE